MIFNLQETIAAQRETVWHYLTEPDCMAGWMSGVDKLRTTDGGPLAAGTEIVFTARNKQRYAQVEDFEPLQRMALRSVQGPVTAVYRYSLAEAEDGSGTRVNLAAECTAGGVFRLFTPLLRAAIRKADGNQLIDLRTAIHKAHPTTIAG